MTGYQILQVFIEQICTQKHSSEKFSCKYYLPMKKMSKIKLVSDMEEKQMLGFRAFN